LKKILENKTVLITRPYSASEEAEILLKSEGAQVINFPTNKITPIDINEPDYKIVNNWHEYDYLIFSSANAVQIFHDLTANSNQTDKTRHTKVIALGLKTALVCERLDIRVDIVPEEYSSKGIITELASKEILGKKILIPCSALAKSELKLGLEKLGAEVSVIHIYTVVPTNLNELHDEIEIILKNTPDIFVFTSPSTFNNFIKIMGLEKPADYFENHCVAVIGPTTKKAIEAIGVTVDITPEKFTMEEVVEMILNFYKNQMIKKGC
jgi:uroporphyrinogen-III synthase